METLIELCTVNGDERILLNYFPSVKALFEAVGYNCPDGITKYNNHLKQDGFAFISDKYRIRLISKDKANYKYLEEPYAVDSTSEYTAADIVRAMGSIAKQESQRGTIYIQVTTRVFKLIRDLNHMPYKSITVTFTDRKGQTFKAGQWTYDVMDISIPLPRYNLEKISWTIHGISYNKDIHKVGTAVDGQEPDILITDGEMELRVHSTVMRIFSDQFFNPVRIENGKMKLMMLIVRWMYFGLLPNNLPWQTYFDASILAKKYKVVGIIRPLTWLVANSFEQKRP